MPEAIASCAPDAQIFVAGGADIYSQALVLIDRLYITEIQQEVAGDTWFPELDQDEWQEVSREIHHQEVPQPLEYHFVEYRRNGG